MITERQQIERNQHKLLSLPPHPSLCPKAQSSLWSPGNVLSYPTTKCFFCGCGQLENAPPCVFLISLLYIPFPLHFAALELHLLKLLGYKLCLRLCIPGNLIKICMCVHGPWPCFFSLHCWSSLIFTSISPYKM